MIIHYYAGGFQRHPCTERGPLLVVHLCSGIDSVCWELKKNSDEAFASGVGGDMGDSTPNIRVLPSPSSAFVLTRNFEQEMENHSLMERAVAVGLGHQPLRRHTNLRNHGQSTELNPRREGVDFLCLLRIDSKFVNK
ncbi:hypothetical protein Vi05172_g216 [Venturia inaequalis]|nr:hypothetical protein Vi05172_g216 [Venturia inaequalis]